MSRTNNVPAGKSKKKPADENDKLKAGTLPDHPADGCVPMPPPRKRGRGDDATPGGNGVRQ